MMMSVTVQHSIKNPYLHYYMVKNLANDRLQERNIIASRAWPFMNDDNDVVTRGAMWCNIA